MIFSAKLQATSPWSVDRHSSTLSWVESLPSGPITLIDAVPLRSRRIDDIVIAIGSLLSIAAMVALSTYAHSTVTGVTSDFHDILSRVASGVVAGPLRILINLTTFGAFIVVLASLLRRKYWLRSLEAIVATSLCLLLAPIFSLTLQKFAPTAVIHALTVSYRGAIFVGISSAFAALATFATVAGQRHNDLLIKWAWTAIWTLMLLNVLSGRAALPGALIALFIGLFIGNLWRFIVGVPFTNARDAALVAGIFHSGIVPRAIERIDLPESTPLTTQNFCARLIHEDVISSVPLSQGVEFSAAGPAVTITERATPLRPKTPRPGCRTYHVIDTRGKGFFVQVFDPDRQVFTLLRTLWANLRMKGLNLPPSRSAKEMAQKQALAAIAARHAGANVPEVHGLGRCGDSMIMISEVIPCATSIASVSPEKLSSETILSLWTSLRLAHTSGLAHHHLDVSSVVLDEAGKLWITDWGYAEVAASELSKRVDLMQLLVLTTHVVGIEKALQYAHTALGESLLTSLVPVLQRVVLPKRLNEIDKEKKLTTALREELTPLVNLEPGDELPVIKLRRITLRQVMMAVIGLGAFLAFVTYVDFKDMRHILLSANPALIALTFGFGIATYFGAALNLVALTEEKISFWQAFFVQIAASVVGVIAPAGIGPAAVNLRFLTRRNIPVAIAAATVGLTQLTQFAFSVTLLVVVVVLTGKSVDVNLPSTELILIMVTITAIIAVSLAIAPVRRFIRNRLEPLMDQVWPRVIWLVSQPTRILLAGLGVVIQSVFFIAAFGSALAAFGHTLGIASLTVTFLTASSVGSALPAPGGIGPVEAALTGGLQLAGIPLATAVSAALLYRLLTFWGRVPIGWIALRLMERNRIL